MKYTQISSVKRKNVNSTMSATMAETSSFSPRIGSALGLVYAEALVDLYRFCQCLRRVTQVPNS